MASVQSAVVGRPRAVVSSGAVRRARHEAVSVTWVQAAISVDDGGVNGAVGRHGAVVSSRRVLSKSVSMATEQAVVSSVRPGLRCP